MSYELLESVNGEEARSLWVFGYGSLCWKPGFKFDRAVVGFVRGFSRKFWQGNDTHRGTSKKPARVATLIEDKESLVYGVSFAVSGEAALPYLQQRECTLGGYVTHFTTFYPRRYASGGVGEPLRVLLYIATPKSSHWLGDAPVSRIADDIVECPSGPAGHNVEYLLRLAEFVEEHCPEADDAHLADIAAAVRDLVVQRQMCLKSLMGSGAECIRYHMRPQDNPLADNGDVDELRAGRGPPPEVRANSFQFSSRIPDKKLRCLNI